MDVLVLAHYYDPEPIPKCGELARELKARGHGVSVITGFPNYPSGELYPGWKLRLLSRDRSAGFPVVRTYMYPYHGKSVFGRLANYFSFMLSAPFGAFFTPRCDVMYVWHPPLTVGVAAWITARLKRVRFVYDVQDIWPESALLSGMMREGFMVRMMWRLEKFVYKRADHILCVTEGARQNLIGKGVPPDKVTVMPHWIDLGEYTVADPDGARASIREQYGWGSKFVAMFAGNLGLVQGLDTLVQAAQHIDAEARVVFVGDGADKARIVEMSRELGVEDRVQFIDRQPASRMGAFMAAADALIVHLRKSELSRYVIPTKTLAYLASGRPIVMAMEGAAADVVKDAGAGIIVEPENPSALAAALREMANTDPAEREAVGRRGRDYATRHYAKDVVIPQYADLLGRFARRR